MMELRLIVATADLSVSGTDGEWSQLHIAEQGGQWYVWLMPGREWTERCLNRSR
jgi:hypothetical protein